MAFALSNLFVVECNQLVLCDGNTVQFLLVVSGVAVSELRPAQQQRPTAEMWREAVVDEGYTEDAVGGRTFTVELALESTGIDLLIY